MEIKINTKYNIGDDAYFLGENNRVRVGVVYLVEVSHCLRCSSDEAENLIPLVKIRYMLYDALSDERAIEKYEYQLFETPQEARDEALKIISPKMLMSGTLTKSAHFLDKMNKDYPWLNDAIKKYKGDE